MKNGHTGIIVVALLVLVAVGLAMYGPSMVKEKVAPAVSSTARPSASIVTAKGLVESEEEIEIGSPVSGTIRKISCDEGEMVKKGQVLVILEDEKIRAEMRVAEAAVREAKEDLNRLKKGYREEEILEASSDVKRAEAVQAQARDEYERLGRLYEKGAVTLVELNKAKERDDIAASELEAAGARLDKLESGERKEDVAQGEAAVDRALAELRHRTALLKDYRMISPFDGVVADRFRDPDETVDVGTAILKIINTGKFRVLAELEETDVGKIAEGASVDVVADAYPAKIYSGKVYQVLPVVKRKSQQTFDPVASFDVNVQDIHIRLDDYSSLKSGMSVTVKFKK
ncbi:MAG: HlyD family efflux transporter periplasmic adaptor subunit [Nitrospirota bacterium]|nr:HlyD family efflux transporter periplasmic adaptor subunit [Nitrospirota bacterium]